jgi:uncharacterized integral membrane protein
MAIVYLILALLIAVIAVLFAWQNSIVVTIAFFSLKVEDAPLSLVLLATLAIGILIGWLFAAPSLVKNSFRSSNQRKRIGALEKELEGHKAKPTETPKPAPVMPPPAEPKPVTPVPSTTKSDTDPLSHS